MVVLVPDNPQWEANKNTSPRPRHLYGRFSLGVGSNQSRSSHWRSLDSKRTGPPHQLPRVAESLEFSTSLLSEEGEHNCIDLVGQFQCSGLYQPHGLYKIINAGIDYRPTLDMGVVEEHHTSSLSYSWCGQPDGRHNVQIDHQKQVRLATESSSLVTDCGMLGPLSCGHICNPTVSSSPSVLIREARVNGGSNGCLSPGLVDNSRKCQPLLVSHSVMPEENHHAEGYTGDGNPVMDNSVLVPNDCVPMHRPLLANTSVTRSYTSHSQHGSPLPQSSSTVGCLAYFKQSLTHQNISTEAEELIIAAWRESTY